MKKILLSLALALLLPTSAAWAATSIYALTTDDDLLVVDAAVPQNVLSVVTITGLDEGDEIVGIDVRPDNGELYALSDGNGLYTIDPATGAATKVAELAADPADSSSPFTALVGERFNIDFNPVVDRLRVVSDQEQNLRINPDSGLVTTDTPIAYAEGDANEGVDPSLGGIAYTNNVAGAATTQLFGVDDTAFQIVLQNPPNDGALTSNAPFGVEHATHTGLDVAPDGIMYVGGKHEVPNFPIEFILATVDPNTGGGESHGFIGDGTIPIRDIAVAPTVAFSAQHYAISEDGGSATIRVEREGFLNTAVSVDFSTFSNSASAASDYTTVSGTLSFAADETTKTFQVPVIDDDFPEGDETVGLFLDDLSGPGVLGSPSVATLRINTNDQTDIVGPQIRFIGLTGPSRGIDGVVVQFDEDMDPASATNLASYTFTGITPSGKRRVRRITSAAYDPVERRVELALAPFMQTKFSQLEIRVEGGQGGVTDLSGNRLDGNGDGRPGGDAVQLFQVFHDTTLKFTDRDGDRVTLRIRKGGFLDGVLPIGGPTTQTPQFWILDPIALRSTLSGTVRPRGDGIVVIAEIIGLDKKEFTPLLSNSSFRVNTLTFSSNATGIGLR